MIPLVGRLYRQHSVIVTIFGRSLVNEDAISVVRAHSATKYHALKHTLSPDDTLPLLEEIVRCRPPCAMLDIGRLADAWLAARDAGAASSMRAFVAAALAPVVAEATRAPPARPRDVVLYGFGRIGRILARLLIEKMGGGRKLRLRAVVLRKIGSLEKRASLIRRDSVHGPFKGAITVDEATSSLVLNGVRVHFLEASSPADAARAYASLGLVDAIVVDNTGVWRTAESLGAHVVAPHTRQVVLTAPAKTGVPNVVMSVNDDEVSTESTIVAAASCTTNACVPVLAAMTRRFGIERVVSCVMERLDE